MAQIFVTDELIDAARKSTGLQRFDSESFREGLGVLLADASTLNYPEVGAQRFRSMAIAALATRLKTTAYLEQHPELLKRPIERPVFITGLPRTGTTALHRLLTADPANQGVQMWLAEVPQPRPPRQTWPDNPVFQLVQAGYSRTMWSTPSSWGCTTSPPTRWRVTPISGRARTAIRTGRARRGVRCSPPGCGGRKRSTA